MIDGIEGCGEVQEDEDVEIARVRGKEEVICYFKKSCFSAMFLTETGLEWFEQIIAMKVGMKLGGDHSFYYFGEKREVGYGPEVCKVIGVKVRFFEYWGDRCQLERLWDRTRGE